MVPENGYLCIFNIQGKHSITQRCVAAAHYPGPAEIFLFHLACQLRSFQVGPRPQALAEPPPHLQACVPQRGVEGTKGQASLSCEPQGSLYRPAAKAQRGWVAWARSHSIPSKPGLPSPGGMTPASPRKVAALGCLSRPPNLSLHPLLEVCLILALILSLASTLYLCACLAVAISVSVSLASLSDSFLHVSTSVPSGPCISLLPPPTPHTHTLSLPRSLCICPPLPPRLCLGSEIRATRQGAVLLSRRGPLGELCLPTLAL